MNLSPAEILLGVVSLYLLATGLLMGAAFLLPPRRRNRKDD